MTNKIRLVLLIIGLTAFTAAIGLVDGCSTSQTTTAYKGEAATDLSVKTALTGWGFYVAAKHPGTNAEETVLQAFKVYKAAELTLIDATASLASNPTNTSPVVAAQNAVAASQVSLVNLISSLTNAIK